MPTDLRSNSSSSVSPRAADHLDQLTTRRATVALEHAEVTRSDRTGGPRFVISTEELDLMGDIVVQAGLRPVGPRIPAQVDHSGKMRDLIGWWDNIELRGRRTFADLVLFDRGISRTADMVRELHDAGVKLAASIGFHPDLTEGGTEPILDKKTEVITGWRFNRSTLVEASVVVVPANPGALSVRALDIAAKFGLDVRAYQTFAMSEASQRLLHLMPTHDARARAAAAVMKATNVLEGVRHDPR